MPTEFSKPRSQQGLPGPLRSRAQAIGLVWKLRRLIRGCALEREVAASMPGPLAALTLPMEKLAEKSKKFAKALEEQRERFESHYRDNRKLAAACAWEIAHAIQSEDDHVAYEFACACARTNRTRTAQGVFERLAATENGRSKYVLAARRRLARLAWKAGDPEAAIRSLRAVRGRAARRQYHSWLGIMTIRNGLLLAESGDIDSARTVLTGGMLATGMNDHVAAAVTEIYLMAAAWTPFDTLRAGGPDGRVDETAAKEPPIPIILSGFGWSGSGAVTDFLKGHPEVGDVFSGRELGLWTGKYGMDRLYAHFIARGFNRRLLLEFLACHCFGHNFLAGSKGTKNAGGIWSWLSEAQRILFLGVLARWLSGLQRWHRDPTVPLLVEFQKFSSQILAFLADPQTTRVLLSNCVPSDSVAGIRMFEAPVVIISWRSPEDAYASKIAAFPDNALDFDRWKSQLMARIDNYLAGKAAAIGYAKLWLDLSFEEFVQDERSRQNLLEVLELDGRQMEPTFDASVSSRNIGILNPLSGRSRSAWSALTEAVKNAKCEAETISIGRAAP